jgi:uncharacterized protein YjbI with pentapeptide repeats
MSRQPSRGQMLHRLLSTLTRKAPEQAKQQLRLSPRPTPDDRDAWHTYWEAQGQPWRTEPEIDQTRQQELAEHRIIVPDIEKGIYPFGGMKLSRADVEWLLATHENGRGPINWDEEDQRQREGLDLRGADLRGVDLQRLPLARMRGGLNRSEWVGGATVEQSKIARIHLEKANLTLAHMEEAFLALAHLEEANLYGTHMEGADLYGAHMEGTYLYKTHLEVTSLRNTFFSPASVFQYVVLENEKLGAALLSDVHWGSMNLSLVNWTQITVLGDELEARQRKRQSGRMKNTSGHLQSYRRAIRAYRQLAVVLQAQGLNEESARFAYRAQTLQRMALRLQMLQQRISLMERLRSLSAWLFSWFLYLLAGYGYRPLRSFLAYLLVISTFMALYLLFDPHLLWYEAIVVSMTAFHGRGFSPSNFSPGDPVSIASAIEAFVGLIIEVTFIATLTRRFFGQ